MLLYYDCHSCRVTGMTYDLYLVPLLIRVRNTGRWGTDYYFEVIPLMPQVYTQKQFHNMFCHVGHRMPLSSYILLYNY